RGSRAAANRSPSAATTSRKWTRRLPPIAPARNASVFPSTTPRRLASLQWRAPMPDLLIRRATLAPQTADAEARTVEAVWTTGAAVRRRDAAGAYLERL